MTAVAQQLVRSVAASRPRRRKVDRPAATWRRWGRYAVTSGVATGVSEATLLALYGTHVLAAAAAAITASLAGTLPSYAMSRFWIWPEVDRRRPGRQAVGYWVIGLASLGLSSLLTGIAAASAPPGRAAHLVVVASAYLGTYGALWVLKFALYQRLVFRPVSRPERPSSNGREGGRPGSGTAMVPPVTAQRPRHGRHRERIARAGARSPDSAVPGPTEPAISDPGSVAGTNSRDRGLRRVRGGERLGSLGPPPRSLRWGSTGVGWALVIDLACLVRAPVELSASKRRPTPATSGGHPQHLVRPLRVLPAGTRRCNRPPRGGRRLAGNP